MATSRGASALGAHSARRLKREPHHLEVPDLDRNVVLGFLEHIERERGSRPRTRNAQLTAPGSTTAGAPSREWPKELVLPLRLISHAFTLCIERGPAGPVVGRKNHYESRCAGRRTVLFYTLRDGAFLMSVGAYACLRHVIDATSGGTVTCLTACCRLTDLDSPAVERSNVKGSNRSMERRINLRSALLLHRGSGASQSAKRRDRYPGLCRGHCVQSIERTRRLLRTATFPLDPNPADGVARERPKVATIVTAATAKVAPAAALPIGAGAPTALMATAVNHAG